MSQRNKAKRRWFTYLWIAALVVLVVGLLWKEQTPLLYILATLGVTILLVIVAIADLGSGERQSATTTMSEVPPPSEVKTRK